MIQCPICNSPKKFEIPYQFSDTILTVLKAHHLDTVYHWFLCKECGNGYQFPKQDDKVLQDYWNLTEQGAAASDDNNRARSSKRLFNYFYPHLKDKKSVLDVGCGHGYLLREFKEKGFETFGIDIDNKTKETHDRLGINTIIGHVENIDLEKQYDVVFSTNSLYFVQDPVNFLTKIKNHITPDGYLCLSLADMLAHTNKAFPSYALAFYPNYDSIDYILALAGYKIISKENKLTNILVICQVDDKVTLPKINTYKILFLLKTKPIRYYLFGLATKFLHKAFAGSFLSRIVKKIIRY